MLEVECLECLEVECLRCLELEYLEMLEVERLECLECLEFLEVAKPHVAGHRPAALAHTFDLAFLDVVTGAQRDVSQDVGAFEDALAADAGDDDVRYFVHG